MLSASPVGCSKDIESCCSVLCRETRDDGLQDLREALEKAEEAVSASSSDTEEERERKEERDWLRRVFLGLKKKGVWVKIRNYIPFKSLKTLKQGIDRRIHKEYSRVCGSKLHSTKNISICFHVMYGSVYMPCDVRLESLIDFI